MQWIDWLLVALPIILVLAVAVYTHRYIKSVADFLAGGRCAGRYLLANARGESDAGLANTMSKFEMVFVAGFVLSYWDKITAPIIMIIFISGFVFYRFRETRALTLAQFFEMRYSRKFRLFMGILAFTSGILNYGIFPAVSARFFIYFLDLPHQVHLGVLSISTFALIMFSYLSCTVFMILVGGQVTLMVTDCLEGLFSHIIYIAAVIAVLYVVSWHQIIHTMSAAPPGHSLINPFDAVEVRHFNVWFALTDLVRYIYNQIALQNKQGFNAAARTPHEARMAGVLGNWRTFAKTVMIIVLGVCAVTYLRDPQFSAQSPAIQASIHSVSGDYLQLQMAIPITLRYLLPVGIKGLFCAMMIMGMLAGDASHLHSWGSILVQDCILPYRKKGLTPRQHMLLLRLAIIGVAAFGFCFSLWFQQTQYIALWWAITAGVFITGAGAALIGGLYWRRGTTQGAWAAVLSGASLCLIAIALGGKWWPGIRDEISPSLQKIGVNVPQNFPLDFQQSMFLILVFCAVQYVIVSLLTCRTPFDLDKILHRGKYSQSISDALRPSLKRGFKFSHLLGFTDEFSWSDKLVSAGVFWWSMLLLGVNIVIALLNLPRVHKWPESWWPNYWLVTAIAMPLFIGFVTLIWFGIGSIIDLRHFFRDLRLQSRDATDDGRVVDHQNLSDVARPSK